MGTHVPVGKGLVAGALARADELGCETIQIFVGNPRGWALSAGTPDEDERFRDAAAERGIRTFIHSPYLVNLGSPTRETHEKSVAAVAHNLRRAAELGVEGVVVHTGSFVDPTGSEEQYAAAMRQVRDGLLPLLDVVAADDAPWLLLEPTAGPGSLAVRGVDDLEPYLAALDFHPKAGICLDTCHVFAAGAPLDEPGGAAATLDRVGRDRRAGAAATGARQRLDGRARRVPRPAPEDRRGTHRRPGVRGAARPTATSGVPFILETPGSRDVDDGQIRLLKSLRAS